MKIVIGVENAESVTNVMNMVKRLQLSDLEIHFTHVVKPPYMAGMTLTEGIAVDTVANFLQAQVNAQQTIMNTLADNARQHGYQAQGKVLQGNPATQLSEYADDIGADLIATSGSAKGTLQAFFAGSVTRGLVSSAKQHLLVVKGNVADEGPLTTLFATDHSDYANRCLDVFKTNFLNGVGRLILMTAYQIDPELLALAQQSMPTLAPENVAKLEMKLHAKHREICEGLDREGMGCESIIVDADPNDAIRKSMEQTQADLLVMGAQGHGFIERITMGSVSYHQVASESYSVLVLRA